MVVWALFTSVTFLLAASEGRRPFLWANLAVLLPLLTIIILLIIPAKQRPSV